MPSCQTMTPQSTWCALLALLAASTVLYEAAAARSLLSTSEQLRAAASLRGLTQEATTTTTPNTAATSPLAEFVRNGGFTVAPKGDVTAATSKHHHHPVRKDRKLYLYAWCGVSYEQAAATPDSDHTDFIATIDATRGSANFGKIINVASTPFALTEAHHANVDKSGKWLGAGGLLAFTQADTHDIYMFSLDNPAQPQYSHGYTSSSGSCMDEFIAHREGGFVVTSMCGRDGHPGGGIVRISDPSDPAGMVEYTGGLTGDNTATFASHGVDIDYESGRIVTADYLDVVSAVVVPDDQVQPALGLLHTAHVWDTETMQAQAVDLSGVTDGLMEARFSGKKGIFWVSGGLGKLHMIDTHTMKVTPNVYCLGDRVGSKCQDVKGTCLTTETFMGPRGRRMLVTSHSLAEMRLVDVSNPRRLRTLDIYHLGTPGQTGAHVVKFDKNTNTAAVATYLLWIPGTAEGIRFPSDQSLRLFHIDLDRDRIVPYAEKVDFSNAATVEGKGASNCHGLAFNYV